MNLWDYYTQGQVIALIGISHREQIKRWLAACATAGYPVNVTYLCGKPMYLRDDIDANITRLYITPNPLLKWEFAKKRFNMVRQDVDLDVWLAPCEAMKLWPYGRTYLYLQTTMTTGMPNIRTKIVHFKGGTKRETLYLFRKDDILRFVTKRTAYARAKVQTD